VDKLATQGRALYSCMLNERGGVVDDLIVYFRGAERFRVVVNAATAEKDLAWMKSHASPGVDINPRRDLAMIAVQGPNAREKVWAAMEGIRPLTHQLAPFNSTEIGDMFVARTGYTGEDGFEIMVPAKSAEFFWRKLIEAGVRPCGLGARDTLRLEAGMHLYGQDMDEDLGPAESGLGWTVDLKTPRDFVGRAAVEGKTFARRMVGLVLMERGMLRAHMAVHTASGHGETTSGSFSPTLQKSIAFARVPTQVKAGDTVEVEIRDRPAPARVVKYPFVRNGKSQIEDQT
jgi:aminomethyltransferase